MKITIKKINNGLMTSMGVIVSIMFFYSYVASMHYMMINEGKLSYGIIMFQLLYILGLIYLLWLISYIIVQRKEKKETKRKPFGYIFSNRGRKIPLYKDNK